MHKSQIALGKRWKWHFQASRFQNPALACPPPLITLATALLTPEMSRNYLSKILREKCGGFHPSQKNFTEKSGGKVSLTSFTQLKLPDTIKWRAHHLFCLCTSPAIQIIWQTYQTLRITSALLEWKKKNTRSLQWPWLSNRSPTAGFHHNSLHTLIIFSLVKDRPQHRELRALLFSNSVWVL